MRNSLGSRGESIFEVLITKHTMEGRLFDPSFLGDKHPLVDFHIDLLNHPYPAFFHASIKTTRRGYTGKKGRLKISISKSEKIALAQCIVPVYVFGIDEELEKGYFSPANDLTCSLISSSIATTHEITEGNLLRLYREVSSYWENSRKKTKFVSSFK